MKVTQRAFLLLLLGGFALVWTFLMGLGVKPVPSTAGAGPGFSAGNATVAGKGATVKYMDGTHFPAVTVYLTANDQAGKPVLGLHKENFTLIEDGQPVAITGFTAAGSQAATVLLVIDASGSMANDNKIGGAQQAAISFVQQLQPGQDRAGLLVFSNQVDVSEPLRPVTKASQQTLIEQIQSITLSSGTEFYQTVQTAIDQLKLETGRKVVLALTDGRDNNGQAPLANTIEQAKQANVPIYTIGLGNDVDEAGLQELAQQSGGSYHFSPSADQLEKLYLEIATNLRNEYALTYQSATPNLDGTRRSLQVSFTAGGQTIQGEARYGVGGVLASSQNLAFVIPLFAILLIGLAGLYLWPSWQRRARPTVSKSAPSSLNNHSVTPQPALTPSAAPLSSPPIPPPGRAAVGGAAPTVNIATPMPVLANPVSAPLHENALVGKIVERGAPALVLQLALPTPETIIGNGPGCQVMLASPTLMGQHARISQVGERYVVDDLSGGQTQVSFGGDPAQLRVVQRNALRDGSLLQLGQEPLVFRQPSGQASYLERRYALTATGLILGSDAACNVVVAGSAPRQARVLQEGPRWVVEDLASGALVSYSGNPDQARPLSGRNALKAGSTVHVGAATLRLEL